MPSVVRVLPEVAALDRVFDYDAGDFGSLPGIGDRVRVALQGRSVRGWVVSTASRTEHGTLKPLAKRLGLGPTPDVVQLCEWAAWRWAGPWSRLLATASPPRVVTDLPGVPAAGALAPLHNLARVEGERLLRHRGAALLRVGPCADPIELVLSMLAAVEDAAEDRGGDARDGTGGGTGGGDASSGSLLVLTPTTGWAERLAERLRRRGVPAAGPDRWAEARAGFPVVVGARAAAFAPVPRVAAALVLDAHDPAYKQTQAPCWDAVEVLAERCRRAAAPLVATSWCPDPTLLALHQGPVLAAAHESRAWPRVLVCDLRTADPREGVCTAALADAAHRALAERADGVRVCVVLQRLGGARLLACRGCGALAVCEAHGAGLRDGATGLECDRGCTAQPRVCVACGRAQLRVLREGITTLTTRVTALLGVDATEVSAATKEVPPTARVVVGTEAVLSRVRHAGLVCFADLDDYLCAPRAHAGLEALRAVGLAGRLVGARGASSPGHVLVQTRQPEHLAVRAAVNGDPEPIVAAEARAARELRLPPHVALCALRGPGAEALGASLRAQGLEVVVDDASLLVTAATHRELCDALRAVGRPAAQVRVEVDPPGR